MAKQTAVEWLIEQVHSDKYQEAFGQTYISIDIVEQALAMEKEQIENAFLSGQEYEHDLSNGSRFFEYDYYKETYGSGNNL